MKNSKSTKLSLLNQLYLFLAVVVGVHQEAVSANTQNDPLDFIPAILAGIETGRDTPKPEFSVLLPSLASINEYIIDVEEWRISTNKSNSIETTDRIQAAINDAVARGFNRIVLPAGDYLVGRPLTSGAVDIYFQGIELPSNTEFRLANNARIYMAPNDKWNYCVIRLFRGENIVVRGGEIIGDRTEHIYTPDASGRKNHDEGHGVCVEGGRRILIENMRFRDLTGDGVLVIGKAHDITVRGNTMNFNRRQGVSVVGSYRVKITDNNIRNTRGTNPEFGIDIETGGQFAGFDRDIIVSGNRFYGNRGGAVLNATGRNVFIQNNTMEEHKDPEFRYTTAPITLWQKADAVISGNVISKRDGSGGDGIIEYAGGITGRDDGTRKLFIHDNSCRGCGLILRASYSGVSIKRNRFGGHIFWLLDVKNALVEGNNHVGDSPNNCFSFRFQNVTGRASKNSFNGVPYNLPLKESVPYSNGCPQTPS